MIQWLRKHLTRQHLILALLLTITLCLALGLNDRVRGAIWTLLIPVTLLATLLGWSLGNSRLNRKTAYSLALILGPLGVFAHLAGLINPMGAFILRVPFIFQQWRGWFVHTRMPDLTSLNAIRMDAAARTTVLAERSQIWLEALRANRNPTDPVVTALVWSMLLWLIAAWAGLHLGRTRHTLSAIAPAVVVLTLIFNYGGVDVQTLSVQLGAALLLMGLTHYDAQHDRWETSCVDYADSIAIETSTMVIILGVSLATLAALTPSLSVQAMRDAWDRLNHGDDRVARSLGLQPAPQQGMPPQALIMPGLPRSHLLGASPEVLQQVVMTIKTGELPPLPTDRLPAPPARHYWRTLVYDVYVGTGWISSTTQDVQLEAEAPLINLSASPAYELINQEVTMLSEASGRLYWTGIPLHTDTATTVAWRTPPSAAAPEGDLLGLLAEQTTFHVVSLAPHFSVEALRRATGLYPAWIEQRYLRLPKNVPERVLALARQITATGATPYDRARAIEHYLRQFPYTLEVPKPPSGRDVADYFLFDLQKGYCDYYATSMVVLARAVGLPARLVIGYAPGEYDAPNAMYVIRQAHAHAWVEVYFSGLGWIEFEPTAAYSEPEWVGASPQPTANLTNLPQPKQAAAWRTLLRGIVSSLTGQIIFSMSVLLMGLSLWLIGESWYVTSLSPERAAAWFYHRLEKHGSFALSNQERLTPFEFAAALAAALPKRRGFKHAGTTIQRVTALYVQSVFSPHVPDRLAVQVILRTWNGLRLHLWLARLFQNKHQASQGERQV